MKSVFSSLKIVEAEPVSKQIANHLMDLIRMGSLNPGTRLPSYRELSRYFGVPSSTVNVALRPLVNEGWLTRRHGSGTFVRKREERLTCVGIFFLEDVLTKQSSDYLRAVHAAVKEELNRQGIRTQVWADPRPKKDQATPWPELCEAAEQRKIQGLIVPAVDWPHLRWLTKLPIPSAYGCTVNIPNKVDNDFTQLAELSLPCLAKQGCRSVGFIGAADPSSEFDEDGSRNPYFDFFERFTDLAGDLGLKIKDEWIRLPNAGAYVHDNGSQESFGYEEFLKLWNQPERPEGLLVVPDTTARGVILGLREKQVRVPKELKLVLHKNESIPLLCPMPATFIVLSERKIARSLIEQIQKQFRGESCEPITVGFKLSSTVKLAARSGSVTRMALT